MYYVDDFITAKELISINNTQKNWGMMDYIHYYASIGNETYIKLEQLCKKYDAIPLKAITAAINKTLINERIIKSGDIEIEDKDFEEGDKCLEYLNNIRKNIKVHITTPASFFLLLAKTYYLEGIDRIKLYHAVITKYGTENYGSSLQCAMAIEHWYNFKSRTYRYISNEILPRR